MSDLLTSLSALFATNYPYVPRANNVQTNVPRNGNDFARDLLRDAKPGKYKVEANFFGDRQQIVTGATTLNLMFSTGWGTRRQQDQRVALRLSGSSETVFVGEFEVK